MPLLNRRGFTLAELMIAIVLLGIVSAALYKVLLNNQRTFAAQTGRIDLQQNIRAAATILPAEFRELDAADGDIRAMSATSITIRAMRQLGFICVAPVLPAGAAMNFLIRQQPFFGNRPFANGDSVLIYYEGNPGTRADDRWILGSINAAPLVQNCPDANPGPQPGQLMVVAPTWGISPNVANAISNGSPVRGFATITYSLWQSPTDSRYYLAQTSGGSTQPLVGPLTGANGLSFSYYDSTGTTITANQALVRLIEIRVRGQSAQPIRQANDGALAYKTDSIITRVALRNNPRCGGVALPTC